MKICVIVLFTVGQALFVCFFTVFIVEWAGFGDRYFICSMWLKGVYFWVCLLLEALYLMSFTLLLLNFGRVVLRQNNLLNPVIFFFLNVKWHLNCPVARDFQSS